MNPRLLIIALALGAGTGAAAPASKAAPAAPGTLASLPPSPLVTKMKQIRACLDEVFKLREGGGPAPDFRPNPFRFPAVASATGQAQAAGGGRAATAPENEAGRLRRLAGSVSFGFLEKAGSAPMITIGSSSYKEGEMYRITDPVSNTQVLLRIKRIDGKNVTFGLGNSEYTVSK
jgi:hypothetical protein